MGRIEEGARGGPAAAVLLRHLIVVEAFLGAVVVVGVGGPAFGRGGGDHGIADLVAFAHRHHVERAAAAARFVARALVVLGFTEIGQDRFVRPAAVAELRPRIVVERVAAHVQHPVDGARSAERAPARDRDSPAAHAVLRFGLEAPVVAGVVHQPVEADRDRDPEVVVPRAGFQQQHADRRVLAQPVGQHAAGRAGPHHDVVPRRHRFVSSARQLRDAGRPGQSGRKTGARASPAVRACVCRGEPPVRSRRRGGRDAPHHSRSASSS